MRIMRETKRSQSFATKALKHLMDQLEERILLTN